MENVRFPASKLYVCKRVHCVYFRWEICESEIDINNSLKQYRTVGISINISICVFTFHWDNYWLCCVFLFIFPPVLANIFSFTLFPNKYNFFFSTKQLTWYFILAKGIYDRIATYIGPKKIQPVLLILLVNCTYLLYKKDFAIIFTQIYSINQWFN